MRTVPKTTLPKSSQELRSFAAHEHRILLLQGGGALGAYEVGVLKALETAALRPAIMVGVSVGAINATW